MKILFVEKFELFKIMNLKNRSYEVFITFSDKKLIILMIKNLRHDKDLLHFMMKDLL